MLRLRDDGLFTTSESIASAFAGIHLGTHNENDGVNYQRKILVTHVAALPTDGITLAVGTKTYTFKNTVVAADQIAISNLVTNGDFAAVGSSWINYGNWVLSAGKATHTAGTGFTQALAQEWFPKPVVGYTYVTSFTITNVTAGSVQIKIGGVLGTARSTNATFTQSIVALTDGELQFVPTATFNGEISAVTVTETHTALTTLQTAAIVERINLDRVATQCTAYPLQGATYIALIANDVGVTPTFTADGVKIIKDINWGLYLSKANTENANIFKKALTDSDTKPTVLVERNSGTDKNFLY